MLGLKPSKKTKVLDVAVVQQRIIDVLKTIFDPEIPVSIYDMGLIYEVNVSPEGDAEIRMTLTTPACPVAQSLPQQVEMEVKQAEGVRDATVVLVWDPPWSPNLMDEAARLQLGFL